MRLMMRCYASRAIHALIIGPPGSGKGTISARMCRDFDMHHLSSGDLLRSGLEDKQNQLAVKATEYMKAGELVPDDVIVPLMLSQLKMVPEERSWVLDGFPRSIFQANSLYEGATIDTVINLDVPFDTIIKRLSGRWIHMKSGRVYNESFNPPQRSGFDDLTQEPLTQREDDKPETIQKRLTSYLDQTKPVIDFYINKGLLKSFSGNETDKIYPWVVKHLKNLPFEKDLRS